MSSSLFWSDRVKHTSGVLAMLEKEGGGLGLGSSVPHYTAGILLMRMVKVWRHDSILVAEPRLCKL